MEWGIGCCCNRTGVRYPVVHAMAQPLGWSIVGPEDYNVNDPGAFYLQNINDSTVPQTSVVTMTTEIDPSTSYNGLAHSFRGFGRNIGSWRTLPETLPRQMAVRKIQSLAINLDASPYTRIGGQWTRSLFAHVFPIRVRTKVGAADWTEWETPTTSGRHHIELPLPPLPAVYERVPIVAELEYESPPDSHLAIAFGGLTFHGPTVHPSGTILARGRIASFIVGYEFSRVVPPAQLLSTTTGHSRIDENSWMPYFSDDTDVFVRERWLPDGTDLVPISVPWPGVTSAFTPTVGIAAVGQSQFNRVADTDPTVTLNHNAPWIPSLGSQPIQMNLT